jgi:MFS transporter
MRNHILAAWPKTGLWQHREFLNLWGAQTVSAFGSRITRTALPIVAILTIDATPTEIGLLSAISVAPAVFVGILLGGWIDRSPKRNVLIGTDLTRRALLLTVPLAAWFKILAIDQLYLVVGCIGALTAVFQIADHAYLPVLVGRQQLVDGNTKLEITDAVAEIGGPSLAGVLVEIVSAPMTIFFDAISFFLSAGFLHRIRRPEDVALYASEGMTLARDLAIGLRAGFGNPLVRPLFLVEANNAFFGGFFLTLYMIFTLKTLGLSPALVGLLIGLGGIGALLGALVARRTAALLGVGSAMVALVGLSQLAGLLIPLAR